MVEVCKIIIIFYLLQDILLEWQFQRFHKSKYITSVTFHGTCIYMVSRGNYFIIGVSYAPLGHLRMWRVQLS